MNSITGAHVEWFKQENSFFKFANFAKICSAFFEILLSPDAFYKKRKKEMFANIILPPVLDETLGEQTSLAEADQLAPYCP